ncbi:MAG: T9SS type A sorting domain-containing protein [Bacteroidota bacterium]
MRTTVIVIALYIFQTACFCQSSLPAAGNCAVAPKAASPVKTFSHDVALVRPLVNVNDTSGGYYQEYWYFSFSGIYCGAVVTNAGSLPATHVYLEMKLYDYSSNYLGSAYSDTVALMNPGEIKTVKIPGLQTFQPWTGSNSVGHLVFLARADSVDMNPANNQQTVPFPYLTIYDWTTVARSVNPVASRQVGLPGAPQPGDFIGITLNSNGYDHFAAYLRFYISQSWTVAPQIRAILYENGRLIDSANIMLPDPPGPGWAISEPLFYDFIRADSNYYAGIRFSLPAGSNLAIGADTALYHNFGAETITRIGGSWTTLDWVPAMELVCDPEGITEHDKTAPVIFPNPASRELTVANVRDATVALFDLTGRLMLTDETGLSERKLDVSSFRSGIYLLRVTSGERSFGRKVVVANQE